MHLPPSRDISDLVERYTRSNQIDAPTGTEQTENPAQNRQQSAFDKTLNNYVPTTGAQHRANGHFPLPAYSVGQKQVGHIRAGD